VLKFPKAYIKGCVLATTKGKHCLSVITDLKLINCVDTVISGDFNFCHISSEGFLIEKPKNAFCDFLSIY
jgi:hypothetical protein